MVETITPVVYGGRARWLGALLLHALGATAAAAVFGAALGGIGRMLGAPWGRAGLLAAAVAAAVYALGELTSIRIPIPQLRRQVPDWWRTFFGRPVAAVLYGAGLGVGFLTYLANGTLVVVSMAAVASGRPVVGALVVAPFGLVRGLSAAVAFGVDSPDRGRALVDRLASSSPARRRTMNGAALLVIAALAAILSLRARSGSWWSLGAAVLAWVFAWSATSKAVRPKRWRHSLGTYRLGAFERATTWAVPAAEAFVPTLVIAGRPREAAILAVILLTVFSAALLRLARAGGRRIACGCFGVRESLDVRWALLRNASLVLVAGPVFANGSRAPISWPGPLVPGAVAPILLASGSLAISALLGWRVSAWLARGRGA